MIGRTDVLVNLKKVFIIKVNLDLFMFIDSQTGVIYLLLAYTGAFRQNTRLVAAIMSCKHKHDLQFGGWYLMSLVEDVGCSSSVNQTGGGRNKI